MEQQVGILRAQLARKTGCNLETIRYYEKVGLLPGPPRSSNGYRVYSPELVQRLQFILRARDLGYAMDEIRSLLSLTDTGAQTCAEVMARTELHLEDVRRRIADLQKIEVRSEEHTSELQSLMRNSYAVFCLQKTKYHYKAS